MGHETGLRSLTFAAAVLLVALCLALPALAQTGDYTLVRWAAVSGGVTRAAGENGYVLSASAGQAAAASSAGGGYSIGAGYWGASPRAYGAYLPAILRD